MNEPMKWWKEALMWASVIPVALLGLAIASLAAQLAMWLSSSVSGEETWFFLLVKTVFIYGAGSAAFVYAGCAMAPRWKFGTGICLGVFVAILSIFGLVANVIQEQWIPAWGYACSMGGVVLVCVNIRDEQPSPNDLLFWRKGA